MKKIVGWLASFRLRLLFRASFLLLILAVITLAVTVLQEEKQRSYNNYKAGFTKTKEQIMSRLYHPSGVLALLNPDRKGPMAAQPVVLPFPSIDFDDQHKVRNAIEMADCLVRYKNNSSMCVGVGSNPWAGGFIYVAGTFISGPLAPHQIGDRYLDGAHRLRVTVSLREKKWQWLAPFELPMNRINDVPARGEGIQGRFTGYVEREGRDYKGAKQLKEFRGWVWQAGSCLAHEVEEENCLKKSFFSVRLPVDSLREAIYKQVKPQWPPHDLSQYRVRVELLPPGDGGDGGEDAPAIFDSGSTDAISPFSLYDLTPLLLPGETLTIRSVGNKDAVPIVLNGRDDFSEQISPLLTRLIQRLPVVTIETPKVELTGEIQTPLGNYELLFEGDARNVNRALGAIATRLSWFVLAMLGAIGLAWLVIELGLIRRIARLSKRTRGLSAAALTEGGLEHDEQYQLGQLRGTDELGILASALDDLLRRVKENARRDRIRAEQEKDMWHAVGHEIMSPLQSLLVLHGKEDDPSYRYIVRMQQAVNILYGRASPSEAFASSQLSISHMDIALFIRNVVDSVEIKNLQCRVEEENVEVQADEYSLEDVFSHILSNADRYRSPGTPITIGLTTSELSAHVTIHNVGANIPENLIDRIFEYGVCGDDDHNSEGNRGQGLFVARTYLFKMGGTIAVSNVDDGVCFELVLPRAISK